MEKKDTILIISDLVSIGNLSATAMLPILTYSGLSTYNLPTSLVSNNFGYGKYDILDTTEYMMNTLNVWKELNFKIDAIATGFIPSQSQARMIKAFCKKQARQHSLIFVDPVMADAGQMYSGLDKNVIDIMRSMLEVADLCYPNYTEACYLTDTPFRKEGVSRAEAELMAQKLHQLGAKSVLITSITIDNKPSVIGYNHFTNEYFVFNYEEVPIQFSGTGDIFSAILISHLMKDEPLRESTKAAIDGVYKLIVLNKDAKDPYLGLPLEKYLNIL